MQCHHFCTQDLEDVQVDFRDILEYCNIRRLPFLETSAKVIYCQHQSLDYLTVYVLINFLCTLQTGLNVKECFRLLIDQTTQLKPNLIEKCKINNRSSNNHSNRNHNRSNKCKLM